MKGQYYKSIFPELSHPIFNVGDSVVVRHYQKVPYVITAILKEAGEDTVYEVTLPKGKKHGTRVQKNLIRIMTPTSECADVPYVLVDFGQDHWSAIILCPYCREIHFHGADAKGGEGHRVPHCSLALTYNAYNLLAPPVRRYTAVPGSHPKTWKLVG